jgi:hypothetical protein
MHGLSDVDWLQFESGNAAVLVPELPAKGVTDNGLPTTRRAHLIDEWASDGLPLVLGDARDPDEDEDEDDLDYLYDDEDDDLDDDTDDDLEDFEDEEEEFEDDDEEL